MCGVRVGVCPAFVDSHQEEGKKEKRKREKKGMSGRDVPDCPPPAFKPQTSQARAPRHSKSSFGRRELQADKPNSLPKLVSLLATPPLNSRVFLSTSDVSSWPTLSLTSAYDSQRAYT